MGLIAQELRRRGHEVLWWNSTYDHFEKKLLSSYDQDLELESGFRAKLIHSPPYSKNISLSRIVYNRKIAAKFLEQAEDEAKPDLILSSWPTVELCEAATNYGRTYGVPVVLDIRDLWPDLFLDVLPRYLRPFAGLAIRPLLAQARRAARGATALIGVTNEYLDWGLEKAGRARSVYDRVFSLAHLAEKPSGEQIAKAKHFWDALGVKPTDNDFLVCYFGVFGPYVDLETVIAAAKHLESAAPQIKFVICGRGDYQQRLVQLSRGVKNIFLPGWVSPEAIWVLMRRANLGLAPYRNVQNYLLNVPNKPIEYLSAGLPFACSLERGPLVKLVTQEKLGFLYRSGDSRGLSELLLKLCADPGQLGPFSARAARYYAEHYVAEKVYRDLVTYLEDLLELNRKSLTPLINDLSLAGP